MKRLNSFLSGVWVEGEGEGSTLLNPTTGEALATCSTEGLDLREALRFSREQGGRSLAEMSFTERGALLVEMSKAIHAQRELLIELGQKNAGNTRGDAKFDIDGASHTLMHYGKLAETLGEGNILFDGEPEPVARGGRLVGQHVLVPRGGVAIHINAFNFPAWGLAEKAACSLLAGMPVLSKPATSTALMTHALVEAVAPIMPEGTLSLLCGRVGDLLDHVEWSDVIAFTGSADTGDKIRQHPQVLQSGAAVNIEADSLNAMILDSDAEDATYDAFIRHAHTEITQKSGQKCTAVRRLLVPRDRLDEVVEDLSERFGRTTVGDPTLDGVTMGPLSTLSQKTAALEGLAALQGHAKVVYGGPDGLLRAAEGADLTNGAFVTPTLLQTEGPCDANSPVHNLEVFGPVSTIIPFDGSAAEAVQQVRHGRGCLVSAIYADDRRFLQETILGLAAWNGRLVVIDEQVAEKALAPGLVTPQLLHGGPGRAGGGEELGGLRGMKLYQQRCALQGNGPKIARLIRG